MYYYIMEPATGKSSWQEKVKDMLGDLGIAGETVTPSAARTIEELASLGVIKGYSTIVAVGSEKIANKVASALINQKSNKDTVLGIIPDDYTSRLAKRIGVTDFKDACQALKFRKLETVDACFVEPNKYFMTEATIENSHNSEAYLVMDMIQAGMPFDRIIIKPGLEITVEDSRYANIKSFANFFSRLFGKYEEVEDIFTSFFHTQEIKIDVPGNPLGLKVDGEIIAKTPIYCTQVPQALKIIVKRDTIEPKES